MTAHSEAGDYCVHQGTAAASSAAVGAAWARALLSVPEGNPEQAGGLLMRRVAAWAAS